MQGNNCLWLPATADDDGPLAPNDRALLPQISRAMAQPSLGRSPTLKCCPAQLWQARPFIRGHQLFPFQKCRAVDSKWITQQKPQGLRSWLPRKLPTVEGHRPEAVLKA